jgi:hypothetical protein
MLHGIEGLRGVSLYQERQRRQYQDGSIRHYVGYVPVCSSKACNCTDRCTTLKGLVKARKSRVKMPSSRARSNPDVIRVLLAGTLAVEDEPGRLEDRLVQGIRECGHTGRKLIIRTDADFDTLNLCLVTIKHRNPSCTYMTSLKKYFLD